jgi:drug/metabolite transporter (DMT)-like permease
MKISTQRQGEVFIVAKSLLWGFFPIMTVLSYYQLSPLVSLAWSTLCSAAFFAGLMTWRRRWAQLKIKTAWPDILGSTIFIGVFYYMLYYWGLKYTSAGNASIIALTETFFSFVFFHLWRREYIPRQHIAGAVLMLAGAAVVLYPNITGWQTGDWLVLAAAMVAPLGNFFMQRSRRQVSSETIMFVRAIVSAPVIFWLAGSLGNNLWVPDFGAVVGYLLINGILLLGLSKIFWLESIHRLSVTKANAMSSLGPLVTLLLAWLLLHTPPTGWQLISLGPLIGGLVLLSWRSTAATPVPITEVEA